MARSLNKATLIGNLGADPEVRSTSAGTRVATLSVATSRRWTTRAGDQQEKTEWHRVVCWEKLAEICEQYLKKGDRVYVEGRIEYRQWEGQDGLTRYGTDIRALELIMLGTAEAREERPGELESRRPSRVGGVEARILRPVGRGERNSF